MIDKFEENDLNDLGMFEGLEHLNRKTNKLKSIQYELKSK